jgi:DNA polymerase
MNEKIIKLNVLANQAASCTACDLHKNRIKSVFHRGNPDAQLVFSGESPGADENDQGIPFVGRSGKLLDKMIEAMGLTQDEVYILNPIKCRPPNNRRPVNNEISACRHYFDDQINIVNPKIIVALGKTAAETLLGLDGTLSSMRGKWFDLNGINVRVTFHPSALLRNPTWKELAKEDLKEVLKKLRE